MSSLTVQDHPQPPSALNDTNEDSDDSGPPLLVGDDSEDSIPYESSSYSDFDYVESD